MRARLPLKEEPEEQGLQDFDTLNEVDFGKLRISGKYHTICQDVLRDRGTILGGGGGGKVFETNFEGIVMAKKEIQISREDKANLKQCLREIHATKYCTACPFIVQYFGFHVFNRHRNYNIYIFMEKLPLSCTDIIKIAESRRKDDNTICIPEFVLGRVVCSVINALRFLKEKMQIIHRDIKPNNILMDYDGRVKICDLGICGVLCDSVAYSNYGTLHYMAPERFDNYPYDIRSDIWSLGITLVEMALLRYPYSTPNGEFFIMSAIKNKEAPRLDERSFSPELVMFVENVLQKNVDDRANFIRIQELPFFRAHDIPFSFIGTGSRAHRDDRPSVGQWIDDFILSN